MATPIVVSRTVRSQQLHVVGIGHPNQDWGLTRGLLVIFSAEALSSRETAQLQIHGHSPGRLSADVDVDPLVDHT
jgi:hypothetical protein